MIIEAIMNIIYNLISLIMSPFNIPGIPKDTITAMEDFLGYLDYGKSFMALVFPIDLVPFFVIFLAIYGWDHVYPVVMWVLRKIPFLGIE